MKFRVNFIIIFNSSVKSRNRRIFFIYKATQNMNFTLDEDTWLIINES